MRPERSSNAGAGPGALKRIKDALRLLVLDHPFFGLLALRLKLVEDETANTMWVDGVTLGYSAGFVAGLSNAELKGVIGHEVLHVAAGHPWRRGNRDHERWNRAADFSINPILVDAGLVLPEGGLLEPAYKGLPAEVIYDRLPPARPEPQTPDDDQPTSESAAEKAAGSDENNQAADAGADEGRQFASPPNAASNDTASASRPGPPSLAGEVRDAPAEQVEELEAEWKLAVEAAANAAGKLPGSLAELVEQAREPKVDWREALRSFVQRSLASPDYRFNLPNRRFLGIGLYLPTLGGETVGRLVIAVDTSASVSQELLAQFHAEILAILSEVQPERTTVIYADSQVQGVDEVYPEEAFRFEAKGRGGTSFIPTFEWVDENEVSPDCLIYLTDLEGEMGEVSPAYPVLWVTPPTKIVPRWGQAIEIDL